MNPYLEFLSINEYYAAGFYEEDRGLFYRKSLALRRYYENAIPYSYNGEPLYPSGPRQFNCAVHPGYFQGFCCDDSVLMEKSESLFHFFKQEEWTQYPSWVPGQHTVSGNMYTHSMPHYERVLAEGLDSYNARINEIKDDDLREGLLHVLAGLHCYHAKCLDYLKSVNADERLISALTHVPFSPARDIYEAVVCWNYVLYLDDCDNLGTLASGLMPYYHGEDITDLLENLYDNLDCNEGYSMSLGLENTPLDTQCLKTSRGKRRPMIEFFVDENTPEEAWDEALRSVYSGNGQPAFYNKEMYLSLFPQKIGFMSREDAVRMCGGGCTEIMVAGLSCVGSLDAGINLLWVFDRSLHKHLPECTSFEEFYNRFTEDVHRETLDVMHGIQKSQAYRAEHCPLPMRTLLIDDCIENGKDYNNGGARYQWSIISMAGIINVIDALMTVRDMVFTDKSCNAREMLERLDANDTPFIHSCRRNRHCFGIDDDPDGLGHRFTSTVFSFLDEEKPYLGEAFIPSSILFNGYAYAGKQIGATPDGRMRGEPLADSLTAIYNKDTNGPTALLKSIASLDLCKAIGTPVANFTVNPNYDSATLRALITGYLSSGGMQLQLTCQSPETIRDAYAHPEKYPNLIVRVGGYSEYFCRLDDDLKRKVVERTYY